MKVNLKKKKQKKSKAELCEAPEGPVNVNSVDNPLLNNQLSDFKQKLPPSISQIMKMMICLASLVFTLRAFLTFC